jgi:hypothetical protein
MIKIAEQILTAVVILVMTGIVVTVFATIATIHKKIMGNK